MLDQVCDILVEVAGSADRWNPDQPTANLQTLIPNVPCALDSAMLASWRRQVQPGLSAQSQGAMLMIDGDYGEGENRQFNERNAIRVNGANGFVWNIAYIHDIHGAWGLDHYEIEIVRRTVGGAR